MAAIRGKAALAAGASVLAFGLVACSGVDQALFEPFRPKTQGDAGSIHLAVAPPIPFSAVSKTLSPTFALTGDQAFAAAIPTTGYMEDRFFELFSAAVGLAPATSTVTGVAGNGSAPTATPPTTHLADSTKSVLATGDTGRPLKQDPMLQYSAATALYQEVRLLEQYVSYAAQRYDYKAFVVRMNIGVQPFARAEPYDVYSSIGFFPSLPSTQTCAAATGVSAPRFPYVLPLLVTDNLEGTATAKSAESIAQLALAISVLAQGFAGNASFGYTRDRLKSVLGTDLNSLLTVSRTADNVIQARLGAASQPTSRFAIVPRNHTITVLMLVPSEQFNVLCKDQPPAVRMVMRSTLRDALNGEPLPFDRSGLLTELKPDLIAAGVDESTLHGWFTTNLHDFDMLIAYVQQGNRHAFDEYLIPISQAQTANHKRTIFRDAVWLILAEFQSRTPFQTALVNLCDPDNAKSVIACAKLPPPPVAKPPTVTPPKPTNTASGTTITTTITTTTNPPTAPAPAAKAP